MLIFSFIYWLAICNNACFRFKNKLRSSEIKDPTLGPGFSYFVDNGGYMEYVKMFVDQAEMRAFYHNFADVPTN